MEIPLGAAGGDVSPITVGLHFPQLGEEVDHAAFELTTVHSVIGGHKGISEVVNRILHELIEFLMIVHQVIRIAEMDRTLPLEQFIVHAQNIGLGGQILPSLAFRGGNAYCGVGE